MRLSWLWDACERMAGYREDALLPVHVESPPVAMAMGNSMSSRMSEAGPASVSKTQPPPATAQRSCLFTATTTAASLLAIISCSRPTTSRRARLLSIRSTPPASIPRVGHLSPR